MVKLNTYADIYIHTYIYAYSILNAHSKSRTILTICNYYIKIIIIKISLHFFTGIEF